MGCCELLWVVEDCCGLFRCCCAVCPSPSSLTESPPSPAFAQDGSFVLMNADGLDLVANAKDRREWIEEVKFSPSGSMIAVGSHDTKVREFWSFGFCLFFLWGVCSFLGCEFGSTRACLVVPCPPPFNPMHHNDNDRRLTSTRCRTWSAWRPARATARLSSTSTGPPMSPSSRPSPRLMVRLVGGRKGGASLAKGGLFVFFVLFCFFLGGGGESFSIWHAGIASLFGLLGMKGD